MLIVSEVALSLILLIGAGLLIRTFIALRSVNPGFDTHHVLTMRISLTAPRFQKTVGVAELVRDSVERINALPGVATAAVTCCLPLEDRTIGGVIIVGRPLNGRSHGVVNLTTISPRYFEAYRIPILRGRAFTERDVSGAIPAGHRQRGYGSAVLARRRSLRGLYESKARVPRTPYAAVANHSASPAMFHADGLAGNAPSIVYFPIAQAL